MHVSSSARRAVVLALAALAAVSGAFAQSSLFVGYDHQMFTSYSGTDTITVDMDGLALEYVAHPDGNPVGLFVRGCMLFPATSSTTNADGNSVLSTYTYDENHSYVVIGGLVGLSYDFSLAKGLGLGIGGGFSVEDSMTTTKTTVSIPMLGTTTTIVESGSLKLGIGAEASLAYALSRQLSVTAGVGGSYYFKNNEHSKSTTDDGSSTTTEKDSEWAASYKAYALDLSVGVKLAL